MFNLRDIFIFISCPINTVFHLFLVANDALHPSTTTSTQTSCIRSNPYNKYCSCCDALLHSVWKRLNDLACFLFHLSSELNCRCVSLSPLMLRTVEHSARPMAFSAMTEYSPMSLGPTRRIIMEQTPQVLEM